MLEVMEALRWDSKSEVPMPESELAMDALGCLGQNSCTVVICMDFVGHTASGSRVLSGALSVAPSDVAMSKIYEENELPPRGEKRRMGWSIADEIGHVERSIGVSPIGCQHRANASLI